MMSADDASSSYSSSMVSSKEYDVFLSFRGEDTRRNFTSHLHHALNEKSVKTFIDDNLGKGDEISSELIKAIKDSHVSIVILSENYASSKWCLEELSMIMECKKNQGQTVIPVFYEIDPSHVRRQKESYERAFANHEGDDRCNKWKDALTEVANLGGWDSRVRKEAELIVDIVENVLQELDSRYPNQLVGLVGIQDNYEQIKSLLKLESSDDVRIVGIWGMGGIGKTTQAKVLCAKLSSKFDVCYFLENVRKQSSASGGCEALRNELFSKLSGKQNHCFGSPFPSGSDKHRLRRKKVLIVLDDVDRRQQLTFLIEDSDLFGPGSRIVVTTRNKQIFQEVVEVYEVKELSIHHSLQLFCVAAFGKKQPKHGYEALSRRASFYCRGIPLALKILGGNLIQTSIEACESQLTKLEKIQNPEIHDILKSSYEGLDDSERGILLDIACFFNWKCSNRDLITSVQEDPQFSAAGVEVLLNKALIEEQDLTMDDDLGGEIVLTMHGLIEEMGKEIVRQESKNPGRRSRIWLHEEVLHVLEQNMGTEEVEGITLTLDELSRDLKLSSNSFSKMIKMRYLEIYERGYSSKRFNVYLPDGLESLSHNLRYLYWDRCCLESLPSNFCAEKLVYLHMKNGKLKKLWDGVQDLVNLKVFDLSGFQDLVEIPNLSKATKLEEIILNCCKSLGQLHPSMLRLPKLTTLFLEGCRKIEILNVYSESPLELFLSGTSIKDFSVISEKTTELDLSYTPICTLPPAFIQNLPSLTYLDLCGCMELVSLSELPPSLEVLRVNHCMKLMSLPKLTQHLKVVSARECTSLETIPTQELVLLHLLQSRIPFLHKQCFYRSDFFIFPGDYIKYGFCTTGSSITIPCLPLSHLCGFICCISAGFSSGYLSYSIHHDGKEWNGSLEEPYGLHKSNHLSFWYVEPWDTFSDTPFEFKFKFTYILGDLTTLTQQDNIKECGVYPVYASGSGFKLFRGNTNEKEDSEQLLPASKRRTSP